MKSQSLINVEMTLFEEKNSVVSKDLIVTISRTFPHRCMWLNNCKSREWTTQ